MDNRLPLGTVRPLASQVAHLDCLATTVKEDGHHRQRSDRYDNRKGTECPSPAVGLEESLRQCRAGEGSGDEGAGGERKEPASIFETRCIC